MVYSYRDRKVKKREFRALWIRGSMQPARLNGTTLFKIHACIDTQRD